MLKKTLIIIGAVFAGLIVLGIVGSFLPDGEPPATGSDSTAKVEEVIEDALDEAAEPSYSEADRTVIRFIKNNIDEVAEARVVLEDWIQDSGEDFGLWADDSGRYEELEKTTAELAEIQNSWLETPIVDDIDDLDAAFDVYVLQTVKMYRAYGSCIDAILEDNNAKLEKFTARCVTACVRSERAEDEVRSLLAEVQ